MVEITNSIRFSKFKFHVLEIEFKVARMVVHAMVVLIQHLKLFAVAQMTEKKEDVDLDKIAQEYVKDRRFDFAPERYGMFMPCIKKILLAFTKYDDRQRALALQELLRSPDMADKVLLDAYFTILKNDPKEIGRLLQLDTDTPSSPK